MSHGNASIALAAESLVEAVARQLFGREDAIRKVLACFLAGGHVLIEDRPGVGKSTLARGFAQSLGLGFSRIQMTSDLMPMDVLGGSLPGNPPSRFEFRPGPLFAPVVLLDELNRASARTQSALLEAMEEQSVTLDGVSHHLPDPFFVMATQNPQEQAGTHPLPDSQLDRFLMCFSLGMPPRDIEKRLLEQGRQPASVRNETERSLGVSDDLRNTLLHARSIVSSVQAQANVVEYVLDLLEFTRQECPPGLSPRAGLGLFQCAKAWAIMVGRQFMTPDDVQAVFPAIAHHRLESTVQPLNQTMRQANGIGEWILEKVPVRV